MHQSKQYSWQVRSKLATIFLVLLVSLTSGVVAAQSEPASDESSVSIEINVTEISDPGQLWIDENGLQIQDLTGQAAISGDITGTATIETNIRWVGPCDTFTLNCRGQQLSRQELMITDDSGEWKGHLQLTIDPEEGSDAITGVLVGYRGNAGQTIFIDAVTARSDASLSISGHPVDSSTPVSGIDLRSQICLDQNLTGSGNYLSNVPPLEGGSVEAVLTGTLDLESDMPGTAAWTTMIATFMDENGSLEGQSMEESTAADGSAGRFVLLGGDGIYAGAQGNGRTGSQLIEDADCGSGYALRSFWIGELYLSSASR